MLIAVQKAELMVRQFERREKQNRIDGVPDTIA